MDNADTILDGLTTTYRPFAERFLAIVPHSIAGMDVSQQTSVQFDAAGMPKQGTAVNQLADAIQLACDRCRNDATVIDTARSLWDQLLCGLPHYPIQDATAGDSTSFDEMLRLGGAFRMLLGSLARPIYDAMVSHDSVHIPVEVVLQSFRGYAAMWLSTELKWRVVVPLNLFRAEHDYELGPNLTIGPLQPDEKNDLAQRYWAPYKPFPLIDLASLSTMHGKFLWSITTPLDRGTRTQLLQQVHEEWLATCRNALIALRLSRDGMVGFDRAYYVCTGPAIFPEYSAVWREDSFASTNYGTMYSLVDEDVERTRAQIKLVQKHESSKALNLACDRFLQSYTQLRPENRLIDLVVALESLLTDKDDLSYKFRLRGAALMRHKRSAQDTYALLQDMYSARSQAVHDGLSWQEITKKLPVKLNECEDVCREAIGAVLEQYNDLVSGVSGKEKARLTQGLDRVILELINSQSAADTVS